MFLVDKTSSEGIAPEAFYILYTRCMQKRVKHAQPCPWQSVDKSHWSPQAIDNPAGISSHVPARRTQCIPAGIRKNRIYHGVQNTSQFHPVPNLRPTFAGTWPMLFGWWLVVRRWRTAVLSTQRFPWLWRWTHAFPFLALLLVHLLVLLPAFLLWLAARRCLLRQFFGLTVARAALLTAPVGTLCSSSGCLPRATTLVPSPRVTVDAPVPVLFLRTLGVDHILPTMWTPHVTAVFAFPLWLPLAWVTFRGCRPLVTHWTASSFSRRTTTPFSRRRSPTMSRRTWTPFSRRSSPTMSRRTSTPVSRRSSSALTRMPPPTSTRRFAWGSFVSARMWSASAYGFRRRIQAVLRFWLKDARGRASWSFFLHLHKLFTWGFRVRIGTAHGFAGPDIRQNKPKIIYIYTQWMKKWNTDAQKKRCLLKPKREWCRPMQGSDAKAWA